MWNSCDTINVITRAERNFYLENGYLIVEGMLSTGKLEKVRDTVEKRYVLEGSQAGSEGSINPGVRRLCNLFSKGPIWEKM